MPVNRSIAGSLYRLHTNIGQIRKNTNERRRNVYYFGTYVFKEKLLARLMTTSLFVAVTILLLNLFWPELTGKVYDTISFQSCILKIVAVIVAANMVILVVSELVHALFYYFYAENTLEHQSIQYCIDLIAVVFIALLLKDRFNGLLSPGISVRIAYMIALANVLGYYTLKLFFALLIDIRNCNKKRRLKKDQAFELEVFGEIITKEEEDANN